nr:M15 family metallopeptidase [Demequina litorisediminis]
MIDEASEVYSAFTAIGWKWGGHWTGREDWMHFSVNGH